ncbi:MAG: hypothetical protein KAJ18_08275, partial [Candidatus Omnitrophica bacterium]|nr:hypothetical protein [Candidatus Omnitrophota bacterium]
IVFIKNKRTMFYFFIGILMLGGIIASTSRISLITAILGIALIFFFQLPIKLSRQRKIFIFLFFLILTGTSIIGYFVAFHFNASVGNDNFFSSILSTTSILPRFVEWRDVFAAYPLDKFPQLFLGWGTGVVGVAQAKFIPDSYFIDNFYILVLVMHGIVGLFLWLVFFGAHLLKLLNFVTAKSSRDCQHYWFIVGTLAFITSQFIEFLFRTTLEGFPMQIYFWVFWGLSMRCMHLYNISLTQSNASELR